jgi:hypothetical protein
MQSVRCVIANIPHEILADIVQNLVAISSRIEIVERVQSIGEVPAVLRREPVDALILGMDDLWSPASVPAWPKQLQGLPIVGLDNDGRRLIVYLNDVGGSDLVKIIEALPTNDKPPGNDLGESA